GRRDVRREDRPRRPRARPLSSGGGARPDRARALAAHRSARAAARSPRHGLERAGGGGRLVRATGSAARRRPSDGCGGLAARPAVSAREISPARAAAFDVVRRVFEDEAYADRALRAAVAGLDDRDRALARQLAYGTVQRARTLDHAIEAIGRRPVRRLDAPVRAALRLGAFQLAFLDGVPHYAAV